MCRCQRWVTPDTLLQVEVTQLPPARIRAPGGYPSQPGAYPAQGGYPQQPGAFPPGAGYPTQAGGYPLRPAVTLSGRRLPPSGRRLPSSSRRYPAAPGGGFPPQAGGYPAAQPGTYPNMPLQVSAVSLSSARWSIMGLLLVVVCVLLLDALMLLMGFTTDHISNVLAI